MATLLDALGSHLAAARVEVSIVVVGGAALALRGWVPRTTHDVDVIALAEPGGQLVRPRFPDALVQASLRVARDFNLPDDWLNAAVGAQWQQGCPMVSPTTSNGAPSTDCALAWLAAQH